VLSKFYRRKNNGKNKKNRRIRINRREDQTITVVNVLLYGALSSAAGTTSIDLEASSISEVLIALSSLYGNNFHNKLFDSNGKPRRFINIYVNGKDFRFLKKLETELTTNDEVSLIPAVSGG
jgi:MoaD family protein